jgi:hypothetical protein
MILVKNKHILSTALPVTSREYKILLNSKKFRNLKTGIEGFSTGFKNIIDKLEGNFIEYEETIKRTTWYLDTRKSELQKHSYILRIRKEQDSNKKFKITLKFRDPDRYLSSSKDISASKKYKQKFEEDILPPFTSKYSHSVSINKKRLPPLSNINDAIQIFPCLEELDLDENIGLISPKKFIAFETTYWIGAFDFENNNGSIKACLNFWHNSAKRNGIPLIAELSFDYDSIEVNENEIEKFKLINISRAKELFLRMQKMNTWIDTSPSKTKTQLAYNII